VFGNVSRIEAHPFHARKTSDRSKWVKALSSLP
jgi:hypothetical protein